MATLTASIAYAQSAAIFAPGTVVDHVAVSIAGTNAANNQSVNVAATATSAAFSNVAADTYTVSVQAQDANNNNLGTAVTGTITITAPVTNISLSLPSAVTLAQS
jgi:hypothetical protein